MVFGVSMRTALACCVLAGLAASGCAERTTANAPPENVQRDVAGRFAAAVFRGDAAGARALLVRTHEDALVFLVRRAAAPWRTQHASIQPARRSGDRWTFSFTGRLNQSGGRFVTRKGDLVVLVGPSAAGAGVQFFSFRHVNTRYSTHHDSVLLPSKR